jgi:peptide/nickel transport system permease protein
VGLISGYFGGIIDLVLMRLTDIQMALPFIVLAVAILSVTQPGYFSLTVVLSLAAWPTYARVVRGIVQVDRNADYVQAALAIGASHTRVIVRYLLRDLFGSMLVLSILDVAAVIIYEATLTFIGMGVPPGTPSLGSIMAEGKNYIATAWWITAMAGLAMLITIAGLNLVAIALRSSLKEANTR